MNKLSLPQVVDLALANHFPLELVPGKTEKSYRFHCLINCEGLPELSLVFGDQAHGYLFDSAWVSAMGGKLRVREEDVRGLLELNFVPERWTRTMPAASNPTSLPLAVLNSDLGFVSGQGRVVSHSLDGVKVLVEHAQDSGTHMGMKLLSDDRPAVGEYVFFQGTHRLFGKVEAVTFS